MSNDSQANEQQGWQVALSEEARGIRAKRISRKGGNGPASFEQRFWNKVEKLGNESGCWLWTGAVTHDGYGRVQFMRKARLANRVSWILHNGPIPDGMGVLHRCDTPCCIRPSHLFTGTNKENTQDMYRKGRSGTIGDKSWTRKFPERVARGEAHPKATVSEVQVVEIRERFSKGERGVDLAEEYGINRSIVSKITSGLSWKHVQGPITKRFHRYVCNGK